MQLHAAGCSAGNTQDAVPSHAWQLFGSLGSLPRSFSFSGAIFPLRIPSGKITS